MLVFYLVLFIVEVLWFREGKEFFYIYVVCRREMLVFVYILSI